MKKSILFMFVTFIMVTLLEPQSISQVGFIIKKSIPNVKEIVILVAENQKATVMKQARMAQIITKKKFSVYPISKKIEVIKKVRMVSKKKNSAVYIVTDNKYFNTDTIKLISDKLNNRGIPLFSNRDKDTMVGAIISIFKNNGVLEKHVNQITASILKIKIPDEFLKGKNCIIDVE